MTIVMGLDHVQGGLFKAFVVRDGRLMTGQQQYFSARKVAEVLIEALGVQRGGPRIEPARPKLAQLAPNKDRASPGLLEWAVEDSNLQPWD